MAVPRGRGLCRMCGERYAGLDSVDIYESRGLQPAYSVLLQELLGLNPFRGDFKPDRLGITCAKLLDDWAKFRIKCSESQKILAEKLEQQQSKEDPEASGSGLCQKQTADGSGPSNEATSSMASPSTAGSAPVSSKISLKRPISSDSEESEDDSTPYSRRRRRTHGDET